MQLFRYFVFRLFRPMPDVRLDGRFLLRHEYISSENLANAARIFDENYVVLTSLVKKGCFDCCPRLFRVNKSLAEMSVIRLFYNIAACVNHSEPPKSVKSAKRCRGKKK